MRKLSIRKKVNILTAAIAIIAFVTVLFALVLTLPSVAVDIKAESAANNASSGNLSTVADSDNTVNETNGDTTLEFLEPDEVEGLEDGSLPVSQTQYIAAKGYEGNGSWTAITNAQQLKDWLTGTQATNAYLANNIENFSYGESGKAVATGVVQVGKIFDGCGYKIDVVISGADPGDSGRFTSTRQFGYFADQVNGTLKNVKFTFKLNASNRMRFYTTDNYSFYTSLLIGAVGTNSASDAMAIVENVSLEILPFASGGYIDWAFNASGSGKTGYLRYGAIAGVVKNGCVRNTTLIQSGGDIRFEGYNNGWIKGTTYADSGAMIGQVGWSTAYTSCVYNLLVKGRETKYTKVGGSTNRMSGAIGIFDKGMKSDVRGIYVESDLNQSKIDYSERFVGQPNGMLTQYNQSLYSKVNGSKSDEAFFRLEANQDIRFAKPNPFVDTLSLEDYQKTCTRVIINDTTASDSKILWRVNRSSSATIDSNVFDQYQTYPLMRQAGAQTYISMSTRAEEAENGTGGNRIQFIYGDKVTLSEIPSKTATYNGTAQTTTPVFRYANNGVFNADASKYNVLYNNSTNQPILPSSAAYNVTIRGVEDANYAYFDSTNRVIALINDAVTATINIDYADISVTSVMCDGKVLDPSKYVNKPINYTVGFTTDVTAPTSGFRIEYRESTASGWSDSQSGLTASVTPMDGYNTGDKTYRFRVLAQNAGGQWVEVSKPTTEEMTFKYDDFVPETQYISTYVDGTWHTAASDVIINPKPVIRYAPATVQVRYVDSAGTPLNGADGEWHKADETFLNDEGYWVDGFKISTEGKTYFQLKAMSETGAEGVEQSYEVWIDRTTYTIDYEVSFVSGIGLTKDSIILTGKTEIKRDEKPKLTLNTIDNGALSYYIAEVNGTAYSNEMEATYDYSVPKDMAIGGTPEIIKIKVRKGVKLTFTTPSSVIYGDEIKLPTPNADGLVNDDTFDKLGVTVDFVSNEVTGGKAKAVGKHEFTASISNGDYLAIVENSNIEVTPRELKIDFRETYRFILDTYIGYGENAWQYLELKFKDSEKILEGDEVNIIGVTYDTEIKVYGTYHFEGIIDNDNYKLLADDYGTLILTMLEYDYDAFEGEGAYMLRSEKDFEAINEFPNMLKQNFILMNDIDLSELADAAIKGTFEGRFDGQNHRIYNLIMVGYDLDHYGLFYKIVGGEVRNLVIDNMSIGIFTTSESESSVGLLAGEIYESNIDNVTIRGEIRVTDESALLNVGGVAGKAARASITNVSYIATIEIYSKGKVMYGGVVGDANNLDIQNVEYIGIASVKSNVTESSVGYVTANKDANSTVTGVNYINKSIGFNGARVDDVAVGTSVVYSDLANSTNLYAGIEYGTMLKQCIDPRYFGENVYGTGLDDAFVITNYNQLVATAIYPYATFKLANNIICHTVNMYDPSNFFGTLDMNGFIITDISGKEIQHA